MVKAKSKLTRRKDPVTVAVGVGAGLNLHHGRTSTASAGNAKPGPSGSSKPQSSQAVIQKYHVLSKKKSQLKKRARVESTTTRGKGKSKAGEIESVKAIEKELQEVEREMEEMGGLAAYQRMSTIGQGKDRGGGSENVLIGWLKEMGMNCKGKGKDKERIRLLEVGALKPDNYDSCSSWMDVHSIDLHSQHPRIMEMDFMEIDLDARREGTRDKDECTEGVLNRNGWDVVSLSLVVNFVPDGKDRGRMLVHAHELLHPDGLLFFVLPLPCISNSRYMTFEHLTQLMNAIGFEKVRERWKEGGKMAYWLFQKRSIGSLIRNTAERRKPELRNDNINGVRFDKKVKLREDGKRNNFHILL